ncbi:S8 family serine peptidase [Pelagibaculum spongiae]|uniref:Peptidase S8 n=1 Tax=Pelagibaculum spongiae TaxID=2080658 RepID=A0A2V1GQL6_9GAMM|nr:S8 family serine peptidase [Pelagibaculum spongiae]PVZ63935.1 peptidase S8 [Pelagibaculum spongiae]
MKSYLKFGLPGLTAMALLGCNNEQQVSPTSVESQQPATFTVISGIASKPITTGEIIVKFKNAGFQARSLSGAFYTKNQLPVDFEVLRALSGNSQLISLKTTGYPGVQARSVSGQSPIDPVALAKQLSALPEVEYAEANRIMRSAYIPNDPRWSDQWHYQSAASYPGALNLPQALDQASGENVVVAVIDSGVLVNHPDLNNQLLPGYDMISNDFIANDGNGRDNNPDDPGDGIRAGECSDLYGRYYPPSDSTSSWHGSHVAGTIAAESDNGIGVSGVAPDAKILPVRALGKCGGTTADIVDAMRWSAGLSVPGVPINQNPAQIINMSLGGGGACGSAYQNAIDDLVAQDVTLVIAAGNENQSVNNASPANCDDIISVAAVGKTGSRARYSNYGNKIDVAAPGGDRDGAILSTVNTGSYSQRSMSYGYLQGTSMATPHVAGVAALMKSADNSLTPAQIEQTLKQTSRSFPSVSTRQCTTSNCGDGLVDASAAVAAVSGGTDPDPEPPVDTDAVLANGQVSAAFDLADKANKKFRIDIPENAQNLQVTITGNNGDADLWLKKESAADTANQADQKSESGNSNESITIDAPISGEYFITVHAWSGFNNVTVLASWDVDDGNEIVFFENNDNYSIPDGQGSITSPLNIDRNGISSNITVRYSIKHTYRGDLKVTLFAPSGQSQILHDTSNDSADNLSGEVNISAGSIVAAGEWRLKVEDKYNQDAGYIDSWSITFN